MKISVKDGVKKPMTINDYDISLDNMEVLKPEIIDLKCIICKFRRRIYGNKKQL